MIRENTSLFLDRDDAVHHLAERLIGTDNNDFLFVVLTKDAMPLAVQIATRLGISIALSPKEENAESDNAISVVSFDYSTINNSGRDLPQDFIFHQEQNLRANLMFLYADTYKRMTIKFQGKIVILVDKLTSDGDQFLSSLSQNSKQSERISLSVPTDTPASLNEISTSGKRFILFHAGTEETNEIAQDFDIIVEEVVTELN